jgi:hypothetical protein
VKVAIAASLGTVGATMAIAPAASAADSRVAQALGKVLGTTTSPDLCHTVASDPRQTVASVQGTMQTNTMGHQYVAPLFGGMVAYEDSLADGCDGDRVASPAADRAASRRPTPARRSHQRRPELRRS